MAKLLYGATMSVDGFIAGPGGDMSWLTDFVGPRPSTADLVSNVGALLVGNRTFRGDDPNKGTDREGPFGGTWHGPQFVLTHRPPAQPEPGVTFVTDLDRALAAAKEAAGDKYVCILGADVARQCLDAGVLDEILVVVSPVLLGDGVRLFDRRPGSERVKLEPIDPTNLWMRVVPR